MSCGILWHYIWHLLSCPNAIIPCLGLVLILGSPIGQKVAAEVLPTRTSIATVIPVVESGTANHSSCAAAETEPYASSDHADH